MCACWHQLWHFFLMDLSKKWPADLSTCLLYPVNFYVYKFLSFEAFCGTAVGEQGSQQCSCRESVAVSWA